MAGRDPLEPDEASGTPTGDAAPPRRDENRRRRTRRRRLVVGIVALALVGGGLGAVLASQGGDSGRAAAPTTSTASALGPADDLSTPPLRSATTKVPSLAVYSSPDASGTPSTTLSAKTEYLLPRTLLAFDTYGDFVHVYLPTRPNSSTGWVKASDVALSAPLNYAITVNLAAHQLTLLKNGAVTLTAPVAIGTQEDPTPRGIFYTTDPLDLSAQPNTAYGLYAIGLSGHSDVLSEFAGGDGQIAIHGTNDPGSIGQDVSHGCVRVKNDIILKLALLPLGTPVVIS